MVVRSFLHLSKIRSDAVHAALRSLCDGYEYFLAKLFLVSILYYHVPIFMSSCLFLCSDNYSFPESNFKASHENVWWKWIIVWTLDYRKEFIRVTHKRFKRYWKFAIEWEKVDLDFKKIKPRKVVSNWKKFKIDWLVEQ